jgi:hypothetical protein
LQSCDAARWSAPVFADAEFHSDQVPHHGMILTMLSVLGKEMSVGYGIIRARHST